MHTLCANKSGHTSGIGNLETKSALDPSYGLEGKPYIKKYIFGDTKKFLFAPFVHVQFTAFNLKTKYRINFLNKHKAILTPL